MSYPVDLIPLSSIPNTSQLRRPAYNRLKRKIAKPPASKDGPGTIYVYMLQHEKGLHYYKVGMTERSVVHRLKEWQSHHKDAQVECVATFHVTQSIKYIERVVHLCLDYCRLYRYPSTQLKQCYKTIYSASGRVVEDLQWKRIQKEDKEERFVAKNKSIEWFAATREDIFRVITLVCVHVGGMVTIAK